MPGAFEATEFLGLLKLDDRVMVIREPKATPAANGWREPYRCDECGERYFPNVPIYSD